MDFAGILSTTGYVIEVLVGVSLIIFVHELGHFMAAKWAGVKVRRFFFGFAPTIKIGKLKIKLQLFAIKYKDTLYGVGLLPFGGFVDMAGEQEGDEAEDTPKEQQFNTKTAGQRAVIFVAGATMNAIFAVVFFIAAFFIGVSFVKPIAGDVIEGAPAWQAGIKPGDKILEINGEKYEEFTELLMAVALVDPGTVLEMKIQRGDKVFTTDVTPIPDSRGRGMTIGITPNAEPQVQYVQPGSPAEKAGLKENDRITSISYTDPDSGEEIEKPVETYLDVSRIVQDVRFIDKPVKMTVNREDDGKAVPVQIEIVPSIPEQAPKILGISPRMTQIGAIQNNSPALKILKTDDVIERIKSGENDYSLEEFKEKPAIDEQLTVQVRRESKILDIPISNKIFRDWIDDQLAFTITQSAEPGLELEIEPVIGYVYKEMPAGLAGMKPGDRIVKIDGKAVKTFSEMSTAIRAKKGSPVEITWTRETRGGEKKTFTKTLTPAPQRISYIGVIYKQDRFTRTIRNPFSAIAVGWNRTILWAKRVFLIIEGLFTSKVSPKNLAGPVGIFTISYAVTQYGIGTLIYFLAMISINLAILNVFPVPVLDGGHLLFLGIEKIKGAPVSIKTQIIAQTIGLVLLFSMAIFVTINDITRLFTGF